MAKIPRQKVTWTTKTEDHLAGKYILHVSFRKTVCFVVGSKMTYGDRWNVQEALALYVGFVPMK
jgi:hypothetical protein